MYESTYIWDMVKAHCALSGMRTYLSASVCYVDELVPRKSGSVQNWRRTCYLIDRGIEVKTAGDSVLISTIMAALEFLKAKRTSLS